MLTLFICLMLTLNVSTTDIDWIYLDEPFLSVRTKGIND